MVDYQMVIFMCTFNINQTKAIKWDKWADYIATTKEESQTEHAAI